MLKTDTEIVAVQVPEKSEMDPSNSLVWCVPCSLAWKAAQKGSAGRKRVQEGLRGHTQRPEDLDVLQVSCLPGNKLEARVNIDPVLVLVLITHLGSGAGGTSIGVGPVCN